MKCEGIRTRNSCFGLIMLHAVTMVAFFLLAGAGTQSAKTIEDRMDLLEALENQIQVLEYNVEWKQYKAKSVEELENPRPTGWFSHSHVLLENGTGRAYIENEQTRGKKEGRSERVIHAFDGTTSTQLMFIGKGTKIGDYLKPKGFIDGEPIVGNRVTLDITLGLDVFPAFYNVGRGIVNTLKHAEEARILEKPEGILEVHYLLERLIAPPADSRLFPHPEGGPAQIVKKIVLDLKRGGIITGITEYSSWAGDPNEYTHRWTEIEYVQSEDGIWIPKSVTEIHGFLSEKMVIKYKYRDVMINHIAPKAEIDRFRIEFPQGTPVLDKRTGTHFVVGSAPAEPEKESYFKWLLLGITALILISAYWTIKRKRKIRMEGSKTDAA